MKLSNVFKKTISEQLANSKFDCEVRRGRHAVLVIARRDGTICVIAGKRGNVSDTAVLLGGEALEQLTEEEYGNITDNVT